jgi:hypothetical protein
VKIKNIDNLCAGTLEETKKKRCALADRHTLAFSRRKFCYFSLFNVG